jgi:hypothetical protein
MKFIKISRLSVAVARLKNQLSMSTGPMQPGKASRKGFFATTVTLTFVSFWRAFALVQILLLGQRREPHRR